MKRIFCLVSLCAVLCTMLAGRAVFASPDAPSTSNVTGSWAADMTTPDGNGFTLTFVFKQDGDKVTGTVQGPQGSPIQITNGKVDGDKLTFDVSFNGMTINHEGKIDGESIKLTTKAVDGSFPPGEVTLKHVKP